MRVIDRKSQIGTIPILSLLYVPTRKAGAVLVRTYNSDGTHQESRCCPKQEGTFLVRTYNSDGAHQSLEW